MEASGDKPTKTRPRGRPPLPEGGARRFSLGLRVTEDRRRALEEAAARSGRSISQEIEMRLEQSFQHEAALGGAEMLGLFRMMAGAAAMVEARREGKRWSVDWETFHAVREAWRTIIDAVRPDMPADWRQKFATMEAEPANDQPPPPPPPPPAWTETGFGLLNASPPSEASREEHERALEAWRKAGDEWSERAAHRSALLEQSLRQFQALTDIGRGAAEMLLSPRRPATTHRARDDDDKA